MQLTTIFNDDEIKFAVSFLRSVYENVVNAKSILRLINDHIVVITRFQALFGMKFDNTLHTAIHDIIMANALKAETITPGGFDAVIQRLISSSFNAKSSSLNSANVVGFVPNELELKNVIEKFIDDESDRDMLWDALSLAGIDGKIFLESSTIDHVEKIVGSVFKLKPCINVEKKKFRSVRVICVDGCLETVGELHALLTQLSETLEPCFIFARLFSDDVKQTLKVNLNRGTLNVIPVVVEFDVQGANTIVDVACVAGGDVVSSFKGELISTIDVRAGQAEG